jgi:lycopene cyclase CruA
MNITYTSYIELPAPCEQVREALADQQVWAALLPGAHKQGQLWRVAGSSYSLSLETGSFDALRGTLRELPAAPQADYTFCWQAAPAVVGAARAQVVVTLHDAVISTHAVVRVSLLDGRRGWPWQRLARRHQIARQVDVCVTRLRVLLSHRVAAPVPVLAGEDDAPSEQRSAAGGNGAQAASTGAAAAVPDKASELAERLRPAYPQTVAHFEQMGALDHLERVWWLERRWEHILRGDYQPEIYERVPTLPASDAPSYDLIYAGGGLGLIHAAVMARCYGWRVLLFDRSQVGCVHREWNISRAELQALVDLGVVSWDDLAPVIMREYRNGVVEFYSGPHSRMPHQPLWMPDVLNLALDAGALLHLMRRVFEQAGGTVLDHRAFKQVRVGQALRWCCATWLATAPKPTAPACC